jgi:hypothetical protein
VLSAVFLGSLAALTAARRLSRQLVSAAERQQRELAASAEQQRAGLQAEGERLAATLKHDRALADLRDLRALLDQAAVALQDGKRAREQAELALMVGQTGRLEGVPEAVTGLRHAAAAIHALHARLRVRLGGFDDTVAALGDCGNNLRAMAMGISLVSVTETVDDKTVKEAEELGRELDRLAQGYFDAASRRAGVVPLVMVKPRS